jgi:hypothetical protein
MELQDLAHRLVDFFFSRFIARHANLLKSIMARTDLS